MTERRISRSPISCYHVRSSVFCCCQTNGAMRRGSTMAASTVRWLKRLYVFLLICPLCVPAFLNLEELNEMKYGIQILPDPVILGQTKTEEVMMVSSKYKQLYECRLPALAVRFHQDPASEPDTQDYSGPDIPDLLRPMHSAPCLVKTKDWWTYEFCHSQHIRQYHLEDTEIKGDVLFLGYFESEFDWSNETAKASKQHRLKRYHSQTYVNGSKCDLNGSPRETEVRFVCEEGSGDYIARVDEPQSCRYVLTIHTGRTCQHPFLRPPSTTKPQGIVCQPALSAQQYMDYVKAQVCELDAGFSFILLFCLLLVEKFNFKIITDPADLMKFVQHLKESNRKKAQNQAKSRGETPTSNKLPEKLSEEKKHEDELLLQEFEDEMADLSVPSEKIEEIKEEMQKEFDNIINEAQQELETEGLKGEFDRTQATQTLETTLDKLLDHLEEKDAQDPEQHTSGVQRGSDPTRGSPSLAPNQPGKIEVKILTRKNAEEAGDQWLTEEDTKSFRELLINLLVISVVMTTFFFTGFLQILLGVSFTCTVFDSSGVLMSFLSKCFNLYETVTAIVLVYFSASIKSHEVKDTS
uniref:Endoplasmic reticulum lectin n=1 Tax=Amphiprion ocellaris TaxID=80972 RepID=A0AAQ5Y8X3_AMPOC